MLSCSKKPGIRRVALSAIGAFAVAVASLGTTSALANVLIQPAYNNPTPATVSACLVDPSNSATGFVVTTTVPVNPGGAVLTSPVTLKNGECKLVGTVPIITPSPTPLAQPRFTFETTIDAAGAALLNHTDCIDATKSAFPCGVSATVSLIINQSHGAVVQYTLNLPVVPPVGTCTVTRGFILNQLDLITNSTGPNILPIVINGVVLSKGDIKTALSTPVKGDSKIQLKAQLITALANINIGAATNDAVDDAIDAAELLLLNNSIDKAAIDAAITTLTAFNEGVAGDGASAHCTDAQEAILKDKAVGPL